MATIVVPARQPAVSRFYVTMAAIFVAIAFGGFHMAMFVSAGVAAVAGVVALTMLGGVRMKKTA